MKTAAATSSLRLAAFALAAGLALPAQAVLVVNKPDFSDVSDLTLNGAAAQVGNVLRLTPSLTGQGGSAFSTNQISLGSDASFSTFFELNINAPFNGGADGIVFVVQTVGNNVGGVGGGIGYNGLNNSVGVEFDTFQNGNFGDINANHVGIDTNGNLTSIAVADATPVLGQMDQGVPIFGWVDYDGNSDLLEVRVSPNSTRPAAALVSANLDIPAILGQTNAFVGFTAGTGAAGNNHDVLRWQLDNTFNPIGGAVPEPGTLGLLALSGLALVGLGGVGRRRKAITPGF